MANDYSYILKYAGAEPYQPEFDRDDISHREMEMLEQDETYIRLSQVRYLADKLEGELAGRDDIPEDVKSHIFQTVATRDAPLQKAVESYVDHWLADYRDTTEADA